MYKKIFSRSVIAFAISACSHVYTIEEFINYGMPSVQVVALLDAYMKGGLRATHDGYLRYKSSIGSCKMYLSRPDEVCRVLQNIERAPFNTELYEDYDPRVKNLSGTRLTYQWFCKGIDLEGNRKPLGSAIEKKVIARIKNNRLVLAKAVESGDAKKIAAACKKTLRINEPRLVLQSGWQEMTNRLSLT